MGAPAVWLTRIFEYNDPIRALTSADSGGANKLVIGSLRAWIAVPMSLCQYLLAMAAVANIMTSYIELGQKSIPSWGCTTTFTPVLWTSLASIVHIIAATSYALARRKTKQRVSAEESQQTRGRKQTASATR